MQCRRPAQNNINEIGTAGQHWTRTTTAAKTAAEAAEKTRHFIYRELRDRLDGRFGHATVIGQRCNRQYGGGVRGRWCGEVVEVSVQAGSQPNREQRCLAELLKHVLQKLSHNYTRLDRWASIW